MSLDLSRVCFSASDLKACEETLEACGGVGSLESSLDTSFGDGLDDDDDKLINRRKKYGANEFDEAEIDSWFKIFIDSFEDPTLIILIISAVVSLAIGGHEAYTSSAATWLERAQGMIEGTAILVAVLLVAVITASQDYDKSLKFRELNAVSEAIEVAVMRGGQIKQVNTRDLCVGDIVHLNSGDSVPADGIFIDGSDVNCDESGLTGEPDEIAKDALPMKRFMFSGSLMTSGFCSMVVVAVGENSEWGRIKKGLETEQSPTPLQDKLEVLANQIGYVGMAFAVATFVAMLVDWYFGTSTEPLFDVCLKAFIMGVTIVVVAVPEGLPLAVTLSLAYSTSKMMEDNNLIRILAACETMGNATTICSDKTGTLTQNRMTVVEGWIGGEHAIDTEGTNRGLTWSRAITNNESISRFLGHGISVNSTASLSDPDGNGGGDGETVVVGNKTEGALLLMLRNSFGIDYAPIRRENFDIARGDRLYTFTSERKCMSVLLMSAVSPTTPRGRGKGKKAANEESAVGFTKGASEIVLSKCTHYLDKSGKEVIMTAAIRKSLVKLIDQMADKALRTIAVGHKQHAAGDLPDVDDVHEVESGLVLDGIFGIKDPLRPDVKDAVAKCQTSGILVRMVTGDNISTAKAIARECGILTPGGIAMEGPDFRNLSPAELDEILPRLQVLARSSPTDKKLLVSRLNGLALPADKQKWEKEHPGEKWDKSKDSLLPGYKEEWAATRPSGGEVVGVTGDGTNDGPALRAADVGLSMGLSGTAVARAASSIVILDDNFSSIVKAVKWGRSVFDNIRRFLQFQLTVNIVALSVTLFSAMGGQEPPLNAVMMLWVNMIMDTLGALALGTEPPSEKLLQRRPYKRDASLISRVMIRNILVQSVFQVAVLMYLLHGAPVDMGLKAGSPQHSTFVFNTFVFCQIFNELNARSIGDSMDVFKGLFNNLFFCAILVGTAAFQYALIEVEYVGWVVKSVPLTADLWFKSVLIGAISLPLGGFMRLVPVSEREDDFAAVPELVEDSARVVSKHEKAHQKDSVNALTFSLWLGTCLLISAKAFKEFSSLWIAHLELLLPPTLGAVVVPALKVVGIAIESTLDVTGLSSL